jgi:hypothetical protein
MPNVTNRNWGRQHRKLTGGPQAAETSEQIEFGSVVFDNAYYLVGLRPDQILLDKNHFNRDGGSTSMAEL